MVCLRSLTLLALGLAAQARPAYRLHAVIQPGTGTLEVTCAVSGWKPGVPLYLHKDFQIRSLQSGGRAIPCTLDPGAAGLPFREHARPLKSASPLGEAFEITYTGRLQDWISDVNRIGGDLVELAGYAAWYPGGAPVDAEGLDFDLTVDLPEAFVATTNAEQVSRTLKAGRSVTRWRSLPRTGDMALLASPGFRVVETGIPGFRVEALHSRLPESLMKTEGLALAEAHRGFTARFGKAATAGFLRLVYSPRGGWWYSRVPLVVTTEPELLDLLAKGIHDPKVEFHGNAHEVAHFWWSVADVSGPHDWINEACAEFSALGASTARFGAEARLARLRSWAKGAEKTRQSVLTVPVESEERYPVLYRKAPLLLAVLEKRAGTGAFDAFLREVYQAHAVRRSATTEDFLDRLERHLGKEARAFLEAGLKAEVLPYAALRAELGLNPPPKG